MAITLEEAKKDVQDALQVGVIDEFQKSSYLLDNLTFDDAVSPTGGGATLTYGYTRLTTQPTAAFRAVNSEYDSQEVTKQRCTCDLKVFGGSYKIDRIIANMGGIVSEVTLQTEQKIKAAKALFGDTVINGDSGTDANAFDGLEKAVTGSSTEYIPSAAIDLSSAASLDTNYKLFLDEIDEFLALLDGTPTALLMNAKMLAKFRAVARRSASFTQTLDRFGQQINTYSEIPLIDLGAKPGVNDPIVKILGAGGSSVAATPGSSPIYAVRLGLDGFHGVSMAGQAPVTSYMPDFSTPGAVKTGEVEMVAAVALKATKAAGIFRGVKIQ